MGLTDIFDLIGGVCLFLFGMKIMGGALERKAGGGLKSLFGKIAKNRFVGFVVGTVVTAIIQSSAATTIMVIGFINSGLMTLTQSISVIMGANVGTTITAWILSLSEVNGAGTVLSLVRPSTFVPVLSLIGIIMLFRKDDGSKETGNILLGFSVLMFGMSSMSGALVGLKDMRRFADALAVLSNPVLGILLGAIISGVLQSSSAAVGMLQALSATGSITFINGIPIILGQNIGKCFISLVSSAGTSKNAKRAAIANLFFNIFEVIVFLIAFLVLKDIIKAPFLQRPMTAFTIAIAHTFFNVACAAALLPAQGILEKLVIRAIPDAKKDPGEVDLDERLLINPAVALEQCRLMMNGMARLSIGTVRESFALLEKYDDAAKKKIAQDEDKTDHYEDTISTFLIKLSSKKINSADSMKATEFLKCAGDFERIADHSTNIVRTAEEIKSKQISFPDATKADLAVLTRAVNDICSLTFDAFVNEDVVRAYSVEPLEQVIDKLKEEIRTRHIKKMQEGVCPMDEGFILSDLLTNMERISDHCSNIAGCIIDSRENNLLIHTTLGAIKNTDEFKLKYNGFLAQYPLANA